jgi:hypothetical protein
MHKLIVFLILSLLLFRGHAQTSIYHSFPDSNAVWNVNFGGYQSPYCEDISYSIFGDTLISNIVYHKLLKITISYPVGGNGMCLYNFPGGPTTTYAGSIREDSLQRKIYLLLPASSVDTLLYDFTLNPGDTLRTYNACYFCNPNNPVTVTAIDSILIGTSYRKKWIIDGSSSGINNASIIEGIGSTLGLLEPMINFEWGGTLLCFSQDNQTLYPMPVSGNCSLITSTGKFVTSPDIQIFPNPARQTFHVQSESIISDIKISNASGQIIYKNFFGQKYAEVNLANTHPGVYFLQLQSENKNIIQTKLLLINQ